MERKYDDLHKRFIINTTIASIILFVCISALAITYNVLNVKDVKQSCYETLTDMTAEACSKIENNFKNDKASLRMLSKVISQSNDFDSNEVNNQLTTYAVNSYITNIAILTKDDRIIEPRHANIDATGIISYSDEIKKGEHISGLQQSTFLHSKYIIRNYVPFKNGSDAEGILFTEMDPTTLAQAWKPSIYNDTTSFCIIDRDTGDIVINDWDMLCRNINELDINNIIYDITTGNTGYNKIKTSDKEVFVAYRPMNIERWEIMFIVDSDIVLADANRLQTYFITFAGAGMIAFMVYLAWLIKASASAIHIAKQSGNIDALTELPNRNSYEDYCAKLKNTANTACIYIDVNGLHEINNEKGHLAGDMMLKFIAETLKIELTTAKIYRIGGDEFIAFLQDRYDTGTIMDIVSQNIKKGGYHISYGIAINNGEPISDTIKNAEERMYKMKTEYYESINKPVRNKMKTDNGI